MLQLSCWTFVSLTVQLRNRIIAKKRQDPQQFRIGANAVFLKALQYLSNIGSSEWRMQNQTRIPSGIWSRLYGWLLWMCVPRIGSFPSALNTWSKVWSWVLIWAYVIWNFAPIFGQQISILEPLTLDFLVRLGLNFHPMGEFGGMWGSIWHRTFFLSRTETWLLKSRLAMCERRD